MRRGRLMLELQRSNAVGRWKTFDPTPPASLDAAEAACWREILAKVPPGLLVAFDGLQLEFAARDLNFHRHCVERFGGQWNRASLRSTRRAVLAWLHYLCISPADRRLLLTGKSLRG
jgi:hypothetical protein